MASKAIAKACHKPVANIKLKGINGRAPPEYAKCVCSVAIFRIFEKYYAESFRRPKCSSYAKLREYRLGSFTAKFKHKELCAVLPILKIFEK